MSAKGIGVKSIRKKDILGQKTPPSGQKTVVFAHEFVADDVIVMDLSALNAPVSVINQGFVQPSFAELSSAQLKFFRNSLTLVSSDKGVLQDYLDYRVTDNSTITFTNGSVTGEIIQGYIRPLNKGATLVADVEQISETGTIPANTTSINLGKSFKTNQNANFQIGAVRVEVAGQGLLRNVGNSTAAPLSTDGDYEEVDSGSGRSVQIELNDSEPTDRVYTVTSTVFSVIAPEGSVLDEIERQAGVLNKVVETTADLAGVPTTDFDAAPTQTHLTAFGERLVDVENRTTKWQKKFMSADTTSVVDNTLDLNFSNLEIGKPYRLTVYAQITTIVNDNAGIVAEHNGVELLNLTKGDNSSNNSETLIFSGASTIFIATGTTILFSRNSVSAGSVIRGNGVDESHSVLEELPNHTETTDFT